MFRLFQILPFLAIFISACDPAKIIRDNPVYQTPMSNPECIKAAVEAVPEVQFQSQRKEMFRSSLLLDKKPILYTLYKVKNSEWHGVGSVMIAEEQDGSFTATNSVIFKSFTDPKDKDYIQSVVTKVKNSVETLCGINSKKNDSRSSSSNFGDNQ